MNKVKQFLFGGFAGGRGAVGLLVLRVAVGAAFIQHGMPKMENPFHWMDKMGSGVPPFLQMMAAVAEYGGGVALILGALTPLAAFLISCTMVVALGMVHLPSGHPFVGKGGASYELAAIYLAAMVLFFMFGPGKFSLDWLMFGRDKGA